MKPENSIEVKNINKKFRIYLDKGYSLKDKILFWGRNKHEDRWVLKGISFEVKKGEAIGLIGENGCGKSTTLKLLTRIMYPDSGTIEIRGRVSSLLELGAGFHPDMTGRENIYTNAAIFGLTRKEIDSRLNDIITFSELEQFIDNPVRTYSSGMYMRLAFSVAINVDADVLLIDEILAVGDINFQTKCFEKLKEIKANGTTIVIVSHTLDQIEQICEKSYWLEEGIIAEEGIPKYVHESYLNTMEKHRIDRIHEEKIIKHEFVEKNEKADEKDEEELPDFCGPKSVRMGNKDIIFTDVCLMNSANIVTTVFNTGGYFKVKMNYSTKIINSEANFGIGIFRDDGIHCYGTNVVIEGDTFIKANNQGEVIIEIPSLDLLPGKYTLDVAIHSKDGVLFDDIRNIAAFQVTSNKRDVGVSRLKNIWYVDGQVLTGRSY